MVPEKFKLTTVIHKPSVIYISWENLDGVYKVYRNSCLVYEGVESEFSDKNLEPGKTYSYSIERAIGSQVVDVIALQTSAFRNQRDLKNPLHSLIMTTIVTKMQVMLSWEKIEGVEDYEIYRNGKYVTTIQGNQHIDHDFSLNESYTYKVFAKRSLWTPLENIINRKKRKFNFFKKINGQTKGEPTVEKFTMTKLVASPRKLLTPVSDREKNRSIDHWKFRYTTFLEEKFIQNPNILSRHRFFQGDGRRFDVHGKTYRTRVDFDLTYSQPGIPLTCTKDIGKTISYNRLKRFHHVKTAPMDGIELKRTNREKDETSFSLVHSVGNPLVTAPAIDYEVQGVLRLDGTYELTGYHDQAPHHEVYLQRGENKEWVPLHLAESKGLAWLTPIVAWQYWRFSNFG